MSATSSRYAVASAFVVLLTLLIDYIYFQQNEQPTEPQARLPQQVEQTPVNESIKAAPKMTQMSLVNISIPPPPSNEQNHDSEQALVQQSLPLINKGNGSKPKVEDLKTPAQLQSSIKLSANNKSVTPTKSQITQRLNQLVALDGIDRTLYFPESNKQQILAYMHNCVGIDVGGVKQNNLTLFSHKNNSHSQIVRAANGFKTAHEQALLAAYAPNQTLVRLYPKWFDERLGKAIATSLGNQTLTQLSGHYALRGKTLWLTNIMLNHHSTSQEWVLSQGC